MAIFTQYFSNLEDYTGSFYSPGSHWEDGMEVDFLTLSEALENFLVIVIVWKGPIVSGLGI